VVDIFDEVEEELRAERAQQLLKRYGGVIVGAALVVVGAAAGWQAWRWYEARQDAAAAAEYLVASGMAAPTPSGTGVVNGPGAIAAFGKLAATAPAGYATLARLREAALKADAGDRVGAAEVWNQVAADSSIDPLLRDLANLQWAQHQIDTGDPAMLEARLKALAAPDNPWHALAQEQLALLDLRVGKSDAAKTALRSLSQDFGAPNGVRERAAGLLNRLGG
jgi:hypothetical protein